MSKLAYHFILCFFATGLLISSAGLVLCYNSSPDKLAAELNQEFSCEETVEKTPEKFEINAAASLLVAEIFRVEATRTLLLALVPKTSQKKTGKTVRPPWFS